MSHISGKETAFDKAQILDEHFHSEQQVYPTLADGITLTAVNDGGTWTLGTVTQIIPAGTITSDFDLHFISLEAISDNGVYELVLYAGDSDTEIARARFSREGGSDGALRSINVITPIVEAGSRIRGALATDANDGETVTLSLFYHTY